METTANTRLRISTSALGVASASGLADLTVGDVAKAAGVSTALIHYHFDTKQALVVAVAEGASTAAVERLSQALAHGRGLETVDRLWDRIRDASAAGEGRLLAELVARAGRDPAIAAVVGRTAAAIRTALVSRLPGLAKELGTTLAVPVEEAAASLAALLDGLTLALSAGGAAEDVRAAYDAFWLTLIAAGQGARRR